MNCCICLDEINDNYYTTRCNHIFHHKCLINWLVTKNTCPTCRNEIYLKNNDSDNEEEIEFIIYIFEKENIFINDQPKIISNLNDIIDYLEFEDEQLIPEKWEIFEYDSKTELLRNKIKGKKYNLIVQIYIEKKDNKFIIEVRCKYIIKLISTQKIDKKKWVYKNTHYHKYYKNLINYN